MLLAQNQKQVYSASLTNTHTHCFIVILKSYLLKEFQSKLIQLTEDGSACSHVMDFPHILLRVPSRSDSGTIKMIKRRFMMEIPVARETTLNMPVLGYSSKINVPRAGLITRLAANMADTCKSKPTSKSNKTGQHIYKPSTTYVPI